MSKKGKATDEKRLFPTALAITVVKNNESNKHKGAFFSEVTLYYGIS
jgi:hypothetical protein